MSRFYFLFILTHGSKLSHLKTLQVYFMNLQLKYYIITSQPVLDEYTLYIIQL